MDKKYLSISEVSALCNIKSHTLRFWEKEFEQLKPVTRKGVEDIINLKISN